MTGQIRVRHRLFEHVDGVTPNPCSGPLPEEGTQADLERVINKLI